jgi:hypothetical protein
LANAALPWKLERRADKAHLTPTQYRTQAEANIQAWTKNAAVRIRLREPALHSFLVDQRYKVMAETGESGGDLKHKETRLRLEEAMLGIVQSDSGQGRPVSAYLQGTDEDGGITTYGPIIPELDISARGRCWVVLGGLGRRRDEGF